MSHRQSAAGWVTVPADVTRGLDKTRIVELLRAQGPIAR